MRFFMAFLAIVWLIVVMLLASAIAIGKTDFLGFEIKGINLKYLGFFVAGIGIAPLGLYLSSQRTSTLQKQTDNDCLRRIGEDFSRSVGLLKDGATAQGGIYALGSLAKENKEMYETVIKIIASYIRRAAIKTSPNDEVIKTNPSEVDIEAALSVIKNRKWKQLETIPKEDGVYVFDLSNCRIRDGDLSNTRLAKINLSQIYAKGFIFENTNFLKSNMVAAKFKNCDFTKAIFKEAELNEVEFLEDEEEKGNCTFKSADFTNADLKDTVFSGTDLSGADLSGAKNLTQKQINKAVGNSETMLPSGITRPKHWTT